MDPLFTEIINAETSAESIIRDRLEALDQWMRDPLQDPLAEVYAYLQGRTRSGGAHGMGGDAMDVHDGDWTETAVFVERVLNYLYPSRRPMHERSQDRRSVVQDKINEFQQKTEVTQLKKLEQRTTRQITQLRVLTEHLHSKKIKVPGWLNTDKLEKKLKKESRLKAKELAKRKAKEKETLVEEAEKIEVEGQESAGEAETEVAACVPGDEAAEEAEEAARRDDIELDAKIRGENPRDALLTDDAKTADAEAVEGVQGGACAGGGGTTGDCSEQVDPCACPPEPTEAEKKLPVKPQLQTYVVVKGDWLSKIAKDKLGEVGRWRELYELNKATIDGENQKRRGNTDKSFNWIYPGQILTLPPTEVEPETEDNPELTEAEEDVEDKAEPDVEEDCDCGDTGEEEDGGETDGDLEINIDVKTTTDTTITEDTTTTTTDETTTTTKVTPPTEKIIQVPYTVKRTRPVTVTKKRKVQKVRPVKVTKTRKKKYQETVMRPVPREVTKYTIVEVPKYRTESTPIVEKKKKSVPGKTVKKAVTTMEPRTRRWTERKVTQRSRTVRNEKPRMIRGPDVEKLVPYTDVRSEDVYELQTRWLKKETKPPKKKKPDYGCGEGVPRYMCSTASSRNKGDDVTRRNKGGGDGGKLMKAHKEGRKLKSREVTGRAGAARDARIAKTRSKQDSSYKHHDMFKVDGGKKPGGRSDDLPGEPQPPETLEAHTESDHSDLTETECPTCGGSDSSCESCSESEDTSGVMDASEDTLGGVVLKSAPVDTEFIKWTPYKVRIFVGVIEKKVESQRLEVVPGELIPDPTDLTREEWYTDEELIPHEETELVPVTKMEEVVEPDSETEVDVIVGYDTKIIPDGVTITKYPYTTVEIDEVPEVHEYEVEESYEVDEEEAYEEEESYEVEEIEEYEERLWREVTVLEGGSTETSTQTTSTTETTSTLTEESTETIDVSIQVKALEKAKKEEEDESSSSEQEVGSETEQKLVEQKAERERIAQESEQQVLKAQQQQTERIQAEQQQVNQQLSVVQKQESEQLKESTDTEEDLDKDKDKDTDKQESVGEQVTTTAQDIPESDDSPEDRTHTVVSGDWLSKLAKTYYGDASKWTIIYEANKEQIDKDNLRRRGSLKGSPNWIYPGQVFVIPGLSVEAKKEAGGKPQPAPSEQDKLTMEASVSGDFDRIAARQKDGSQGSESAERLVEDKLSEQTEGEQTDGEQAEEVVREPQNEGTDYPEYNELIAKLIQTRTSYLARYETVRFMGSATAYERIAEELEANIADLQEARSLAAESIQRTYDKTFYPQKTERDAADARLKDAQGEAMAEERELLQTERDEIDAVVTALQLGHQKGNAFYKRRLDFEFSQLEAVKGAIEGGQEPSAALSESYAEATGGQTDMSQGLEHWVAGFDSVLKASFKEFNARYAAVQFSGSVSATYKLGKELDQVITAHKREKDQGFEKFKEESSTNKEYLNQLKGDISGYLEKTAVSGKAIYQQSEDCKKFIAEYKGKDDPKSAEKLASRIEAHVQQLTLNDDRNFSNAELDLDFELSELDTLKSAIESGGPVNSLDRETLKIDFGDDEQAWFERVSVMIGTAWQDFDKRRQETAFSGSASAKVKIGLDIDRSVKGLTFQVKKGSQHFEDLFEDQIKLLQDERRELKEGASDADLNAQIDALRVKQNNSKENDKALEDQLGDLQVLKTALESGFGPTASAAAVGRADTSTQSFEVWAKGFIADIDADWKVFNESYQGAVYSGSAEAVAKIGRDLDQLISGYQKGRDRSVQDFKTLYDKRVTTVNRVKEGITYGRDLGALSSIENPYDPSKVIKLGVLTKGYSATGKQDSSYTTMTSKLENELKKFDSRRDKVIEGQEQELDRCFKNLTTLKESISSGKKASKADAATQFSEATIEKMDVANASDIHAWADNMVEMLVEQRKRLEQDYNLAWASGSSQAVELFKESFDQKLEVISTRMSTGITHFERASEKALDDQEEEGTLTTEARIKAEQKNETASRESEVRIKAAYRPLEQLKADADAGLRGGASAAEGEAAAGDETIKQIDDSTYPKWLVGFSKHLQTYRKTQLKIYRTQIWASGSLSACQKMSLRVTQQTKTFQIINDNKAAEFKERFHRDQDALDLLKRQLENEEDVKKADFKGSPAEPFAKMRGHTKDQRIIQLIEEECSKNDEQRERTMVPLERVVSEQFTLLEELQSVIAEGKRARPKLDREPTAGEGEQDALETVKPKSDRNDGNEEGGGAKAGEWPVKIPEGRWSISVSQRPSESMRAIVFKADQGEGTHELSKAGKVVVVKSKPKKRWKLGVRYREGKKWERSLLRKSKQEDGFKISIDDKTGSKGFKDTTELVVKPHTEKTAEGPTDITASDASMAAALKILTKAAKAAGRITGADFQRAVIIGMEDLDSQAGLKGNEYADLVKYAAANDKLMDPDAHAKFEVVKEHCAKAPGSGMALKIFSAMISKMQVTVGAVDEAVDSAEAKKYSDVSMGQALAKMEAESKANNNEISGAIFEKAVIKGMGDLDAQAGTEGKEWADLKTWVAANRTRMDNDAFAKFKVVESFVAKARGSGMAIKIWNDMLRKLAVTTGPDEEAPKQTETTQTTGQTSDTGDGAPGKGIPLPAGNWSVVVKAKNAGFSQRFVIAGAKQGSGAHHKETPNDSVDVASSRTWFLNIEHKNGKKPWASSTLRWRAGSNTLFSEDWTDGDFNDFILKVNPRSVQEPGSSTPPPDVTDKKETSGDGGVSLPAGHWQLKVTDKVAAFRQRFIVADADTGSGRYNFKRIGQKAAVVSSKPWRLQVKHKNGERPWTPSKHQLTGLRGGDFRLNTEDWTDNDYNDLVINIKRQKTEGVEVTPESSLNPSQEKGLVEYKDRLRRAHVRPKMVEPLSQALEVSSDKDKAELRKRIKPIARRVKDHELLTVTTSEHIQKSTIRTAKVQGSRLLQIELEKISRQRGLTVEQTTEHVETQESKDTSKTPRHLNVDLDPNLQSRIDDKLTGSSNKRDVNRHRRMAQEAEALLNRKKGTRRGKRRHADELERVFTGLLPGKIGMSITFQEGEGSDPKMQDVQIRIAPNDTVLDTITDITDNDDKQEPPTLSKREKRRYRRMAKNSEDALQSSGGGLADKSAQARDLEELYNPQIRNPIDMDIRFDGPPEDGGQETEVRIAPDDDKLTRPHNPKHDIVEAFFMPLDESRLDLDATTLTGLNDSERKQAGDDFKALSNDNRNEVEILVALGRELASGRKAKKKDEQSDNDALSYIVSLSGRPGKICRSVVVMMGDELGELLRAARYDRLWGTEESASATMQLLAIASDSTAKKIANEILSTSFFSFDWAVNRFEARLAWELLLTLPYAERVNLLTNKGWGKDEAEKELAKRSQKRISKNLSQEYRESSRYDLYSGDTETAYGTLPDVSTLPEDATQQEKDAFAKERKRIQTETGIYEEVTNQNASKVVTRDTDRQALLAQLLEPELWSTGPEPKLRALLKMAIQADEAPFVESLVKKHWATYENMFMGLGFLQDGRFSELIEDNTFNTTLGRIFGALGSLGGILSLAGVLLLDKDVGTLDLRSVESLFLRDFAGIELANVNDPEAREELRKSSGIEFEEIKGAKARKALGILLGGAGAVSTLLSITGWGPDKLLETLQKGSKAGTIIQNAINKGDVKVIGEGDQHTDPNMANKLILSQDDETGATRINLPLLPIAGQAMLFGTTTVKTGSAAIINAEIELKLATARDNKRHMEMTVNAVKINDLSLISPDDQVLISSMEIEGFRFFADITDAKPANLMTRILFDIQNAVISILQMIPMGFLGNLATGATGLVSDVVNGGLSNMDLDTGDVENIQFGIGRASIKGITTSKGDYIGELSIGKTDLNAVPAVSALLDWKSESELKAEISELDAEIVKVTAKKDAKKNQDGKAVEYLQDQIDWLNNEKARISARLTNYAELLPKHDKLVALTKKLELLNAAAPSESNKKSIARVEEDISVLQVEMGLLAGSDVTGTMGAITIKDIDWGGSKVGSMTTGVTTFGVDDTDGKTLGKLTASNDGITVTDIELGASDRRDMMIPGEIAALDKSLKEITDKQAALKANGRLSDRQIREYDALDVQRVGLDKRRSLLAQELRELQPLLAEYKLLRARLSSHDNPLTTEERTRLLDIRQQLEQGPTQTIKEVKATDLHMHVGAARTEDGTGVTGGITAGNVTITDITLSGSSSYLEDGTTTISSVSMDGVSVTGSLLGTDTEGTDLSEELLLNDGLTVGMKADKIKVSTIETEGTGDIVARQAKDNADKIKSTRAEISRLEGITDRTADEDARLSALRSSLTVLEHREGMLLAREGERGSLQDFIARTQGRLGELLDNDKIDRSRGYSYESATEGNKTLLRELWILRHGKTKALDEQSEDNALARIASYKSGFAELKTIYDGLLADKPMEKDKTILNERADFALNEKKRDDLEVKLETIRGLIRSWEDNLANIQGEISRMSVRQQGIARIMKVYKSIVDDAEASGVLEDHTVDLNDAKQVEVVKGLQKEKLSKLSVNGLIKTAQSQVGEWDGSSIESVDVTKANLNITGIGNALRKDKYDAVEYNEDGAWAGAIQISGGGESGEMVGSMEVTGIKQGDKQLMESLKLNSLKGNISVKQTGEDAYEVKVTDFEIGSVTLSRLDWDSPDYGVVCEGDIALNTIKATIDMNIDGETTTGSMSAFSIATIKAPKMKVAYGDYNIDLGETTMGSPELSAVSVSDYDLVSGAFSDITIGSLDNTGMQTDMGGGMVVGAEKMKIGKLKMSMKVDKAGKDIHGKDVQRTTGNEHGLEHSGETGEAYANLFDMDIEGMDIDDLRLQMQDSGLDVKIDKIKGGKIKGFYMDMATGLFGFSDIAMPSIKMGPIRYEVPGMSFTTSGLTMSDVHMAADGKMLFDRYEKEDLEKKNPYKVPDSMPWFVFSKIAAKDAVLDGMNLKMTDDSGATTAVTMSSARIESLDISKYDLNTGSMNASIKGVALDDLGVTMTDEFTTTEINGNFDVGALDVGMIYDKDGNLLKSETEIMNASGALDYSETTIDRDIDGKPTRSETALNDVAFDMNRDASKGPAKITTELKKTKSGRKIDTMTFSNIRVGKLNLGAVKWGFTDGDVSTFDAAGLRLSDVRVSGYTENWMETIMLSSGEQMPMPHSRMGITKMFIGEANAGRIHYYGKSTREVDGKPRTEITSVELGGKGKPAVLKSIDISNLVMEDGKTTAGKIDLGSIDAASSVKSTTINDGVSSTMTSGAGIKGGKISIEFLEDGDLTKVTMGKPVIVSNATMVSKDGDATLTINAPKATVTGLDISMYDAGEDGFINQQTKAHVGKILFDKTADFTYLTHNKPEKDNDEKSTSELEDEIEAAEDLHRTFASMNWDALLATVNGTIGADLNIDNHMDLTIDLDPIPFIDLLPEVTIPTSEIDLLHNKIGIPVMNGYVNLLATKASSGMLVNILVSSIQMLLGPAFMVGTDLLPINLAWFSKQIANSMKPEDATLGRLQGELFWRQFMEKYYTSQGMSPEEAREKTDDKAASEYASKVQSYDDLKELAQTFRDMGWGSFADGLDDLYKAKVDGYLAKSEYMDVFLDNFDIDLKGGPVQGSTLEPEGSGWDSQLAWENISLSSFDLDFEDIGKGVYSAGVDLKGFSYSKTVGSLGMNYESTQIDIGEASIDAGISRLFPKGRFAIAGGLDDSQVQNPIKGTLDAGSFIKDVDVDMKLLYLT